MLHTCLVLDGIRRVHMQKEGDSDQDVDQKRPKQVALQTSAKRHLELVALAGTVSLGLFFL